MGSGGDREGRSGGIYTARAAKSTLICCKTEPFVISQMRVVSFYQEHRTFFALCDVWRFVCHCCKEAGQKSPSGKRRTLQ